MQKAATNLPSAYYLPLSAACFLLSAFCPLPPAYCLLPFMLMGFDVNQHFGDLRDLLSDGVFYNM